MKNTTTNFLPLMLAAIIIISCSTKNKSTNNPNDVYTHVKSNFQNPETSSGVNCWWWWWLNGNVTKAAITKDLEAIKSQIFQGAMVFDAGGHNQRGNRDIPAGPLFGSDEWNELFVFALDEAKRLGLEIGFNIQSGWNLGVPRVTPEYTAKQTTFSEARISGSKNVSLKLKMPNTRRDFYEEIAVLAFPIVEQQKTDETITYLDLKLGFHELGGSAPDTRFLLTNTLRNNATMADNSSYIVKKDDILGIFCRNPCQSADYLVGAAVRAVYRLHAPHTIRRSGGQVCCRCTLLLWRPCAECVPA